MEDAKSNKKRRLTKWLVFAWIISATLGGCVISLNIQKNNSNSNQPVVPGAREALNKFKMEAASEVGVNLKQGYNGDLSSREAGSVGGQMVKKMIEAYENGMK